MSSSHGYVLDPGWRLLLAELGLDPPAVLRLAGLPEDLFHQTTTRLSVEAHDRFVQAVDDLVGDPRLPIHMVERMDVSTFSPPLFVALCSPDLRVASQRVALFKPLHAPIRLHVQDGGGDLTLTYRGLHGPYRPAPLFHRFELLFFTKVARMGTRHRVAPLRVMSPELPDDRAPFEDYLGCALEEGPETAITFRAADADRPFLTTNPHMWEVFEPPLRQRLAELQGETSFADRTRAVLIEFLPAGISDVGSVAARLTVSSRTLQRRLRDEGTSFQGVVRQLREDLAHHYLQRTALTATEIAYLVGFDQPSSFFRAFQAWTGRTPESVRAS